MPIGQATFSLSDVYNFIDEETKSKLVPLILANMSEFYVQVSSTPIVMGQQAYPIPYRAIAMKLRDVSITPNPNQPDLRYGVERIEPTELFTPVVSTPRMAVQKMGFYLQSNNVMLYPTPQNANGAQLNLSYYMRPSEPVDPSVCAQITAISGSTVTVTSIPSNLIVGSQVDFVKAEPGFDCTAIDQTILSAGTNTLTFSSVPSSLSVGDYVCPATQTCVLQVPEELLPLLSQYCVVRVLEAQGDLQNLQPAMAELQKLETNANMLLAPRVDGKLKRVINSKSIARFV